jgi:formiminotetrahydrofolate cyclodeaminase
MSDSDEVWMKKYSILKKKCDSIDTENQILYQKLKKIKKMCQNAEHEKKLLEKRLQSHEEQSKTTPENTKDNKTLLPMIVISKSPITSTSQ